MVRQKFATPKETMREKTTIESRTRQMQARGTATGSILSRDLGSPGPGRRSRRRRQKTDQELRNDVIRLYHPWIQKSRFGHPRARGIAKRRPRPADGRHARR
jgi:hypothetical protein